MNIIVTGGRDFHDRLFVFAMLHEVVDEIGRRHIECIASGDASGVDNLVREWCRNHHMPYRRFAADWHLHGKAAGPMRNARMLAEVRPSLVVAFPGGKGTQNMVALAVNHGVEVRRFEVEERAVSR